MAATTTTLNIGLLMLPRYQWLDAVGPIDLLNNHSRETMEALQVPPSLCSKSPIIYWHYISHSLDPVATSGPPQRPSCTYGTAPALDYLLIPGPDPNIQLPPGCEEYLKKVFADENVKLILTVCTGSTAIASTGLLDGLRVCSNKVVLKMLVQTGKLNRNVKWVGDRRWVKDGKVWSASGVSSGIDLGAEFARVHFDAELVEFVKNLNEYSPKPDQPDEFAHILEGINLG